MFEIRTRRLLFRKRFIWFAPRAADIGDCDAVFYLATDAGAEAADPGFACSPTPTFLLDLTQDADALMGALKRTCRQNVRLAEKAGITIRINSDHAAFEALYRDFATAKGYDADVADLPAYLAHGRLYTAWLDDMLLGGLLTVEDERQARWLVSGSRRLEDGQTLGRQIGQANRLLVWRAALDAQARGCAVFDLGGHYEGDDDSDPRAAITRFKLEFGGERTVRYRCVKTYNPVYRLLKRRRGAA